MNLLILPWMNTKHALRRPFKRQVILCKIVCTTILVLRVYVIYTTLAPVTGLVCSMPATVHSIYIISGLFQMFGMSKIVSERNAAAVNEVESSLPLRTVSK